ncbi:MAG TPA: hypothetical protein VKH36_07730, partial [Acidimicrobiia bacterium]|nr:hypothetical protein [Acidimicrobiia bacterium]
ILYEMLAGRAPFSGDTDMATAVARLTNAPEPVRSVRPEVPRPLEDVVARSLARDPDYRYPSAKAFKDALSPGRDTAPTGPLVPPRPAPDPPDFERTQVGAPSPAAPPPAAPAHAPAATPRRRRWWPWLLLVLALLGAGGAAAYLLATSSDDAGPAAKAGAASRALPIVAARDFDPAPGDGSEHPDETRFAIDGDPRTTWQTESYANRNFGNAKSGVGLWVQLDAAHDISSIVVTTLEDGWSAQIYVADQPGDTLAAWGPARAGGDGLPAVNTFALQRTRGQYVLIWCTQLPETDKLQIGDVKVEGR